MTAGSTALDVAENQFGQPLGPDLIRRVETASLSELAGFQQAVREFGKSADVPAKKSGGELRPYAAILGRNWPEIEHGLALAPEDFDDPQRGDVAFEALKHHLLYCHSIAIDNPLAYILDPFVVKGEQQEGYRERARLRLVNYLRLLDKIEPLVRSSVVVLVEDQPWRFYRFRQLVDQLDVRSVADRADFSDVPRWLSAKLEEHGALAREVAIEEATHHLQLSLDACSEHPAGLDLYLPYAHYQQILREVARSAIETIPERPREVELGVLDGVLNVLVPGLAHLEPADLVAIRQSDEGFARWRGSLERALGRIHELDPALIDPDSEKLRIVEDEYRAQRGELEASIEKSGFLSHARAGTKRFSIGAVGALALTPFFGPAGALAAGGASFALNLLYDYLAGRRERDQAEALHRLHLVFHP